jgi:predicted acetyltransferase
MNYRTISLPEIPLVAEIQARAFRQDVSRYVDSYQGGGRMGWQDLRLLENQRGEPVAAVTLFRRAMSLHGGELEAGLVGSVAVAPEYRRRGYGRQLMQGVLEELHRHQTPISLLFPFSVAWYRSLGYGLANMTWHVELPLRLLTDDPERLQVRRARPDDEAGIRACYERARRQPDNNGWLSRSHWEWQRRAFKPEHERVVFVTGDQVEGYLLYTLDWEEVEVVEWVSVSDRAWRGLLAFLGTQGEQAKVLKANLPRHTPLFWALPEPYDRSQDAVAFVFRRLAQLVNGFMVRLVHVPTALRERRYPAHAVAELRLEIEDPQLPANSQPLHVRIRDGQADVDTAPTGSNRTPVLQTDISTLSQLYAGVLTAEQARAVDRLQGDDPSCRELTTAFSAAPWHMWSTDWF